MNTDQIAAQWKQLEGTIKTRWADLTDNDLLYAKGSWERLVGVIQSRYGRVKESVEHEVTEFRQRHESRTTPPPTL